MEDTVSWDNVLANRDIEENFAKKLFARMIAPNKENA